jgi:hypothetical protein
MKSYSAFSTTLVVAGFLCLALRTVITVPGAFCQAGEAETSKILPKSGERVPLDPDHYIVYGFDKAPKLGTAIMKVEIFARNGSHDTTFVVKGDVDMPSMRGAHTAGDKRFSVSKKGVYLLPVTIAMPGEWELKFTFEKDGKAVFHGTYRFVV